MPTTRPRHLVTESDDLAAALDAAAARWPGLSRPQLLVRLASAAHQDAEEVTARYRQRRLAALRRHSGTFPGLYEPGHLEKLRDECPE